MPKHPKLYTAKLLGSLKRLPRSTWRWFVRYWRKSWWHKTIVLLALLIGLSVGSMYGIARWYIWQQSGKPLVLGASFIPDYARSLGLSPQKTLDAMLYDLGIRHLRLVSYWNDIEPQLGHYDFSELDWQFQAANAAHAKVSLSIGLRQPRWPECHVPDWAMNEPETVWASQLKTFMQAVIERYKNNPALESYQLENEFLLHVFGRCTNFDRNRLIDEFHFVKKLDPSHPVIIARSNNAIGLPVRQPTPDEFGVSVYKRVWVPIIGRYVEYPFPAWFYGFLAGAGELLTGKNMVIHELQAEPWPPHGANLIDTSIDEQNKSLNAERLKGRFNYGEGTGIRQIDLWGAEFWYFRKETLHDPSLWNVAKQEFTKASTTIQRHP